MTDPAVILVDPLTNTYPTPNPDKTIRLIARPDPDDPHATQATATLRTLADAYTGPGTVEGTTHLRIVTQPGHTTPAHFLTVTMEPFTPPAHPIAFAVPIQLRDQPDNPFLPMWEALTHDHTLTVFVLDHTDPDRAHPAFSLTVHDTPVNPTIRHLLHLPGTP